MFKFNFSSENQEDQKEQTAIKPTNPIWSESKEVLFKDENNDLIRHILTNCEENRLNCKDVVVKYFSTVDILNVLRTSDDYELTKELRVLSADQNHSDLQTAIYEGGLKIWECTYDLINFISDNHFCFKDKRVLDLGCGAGLIGLLCLLKGSSNCVFQDYNDEILQYITIPNVKLNNEDLMNKSSFYSGDWQSFTDLLSNQKSFDKFDYIFTSETIYNAENYGKLHHLFNQLLKKEGEIYLAAKSYYFGVGGGVSLFEDFLRSKNTFRSTSCWKCAEGLKRDILKISFERLKR